MSAHSQSDVPTEPESLEQIAQRLRLLDTRFEDHLALQHKQLEEAQTANLIAYLRWLTSYLDHPVESSAIEQRIRERLDL